ncbi:hypothetical protein F4780DRAFT_764738 [Xylariomycetidae sp. FL0641]|nr:hypothetical protein F4780DRAFT_764738 [Xylariomycetidae sp. FL0641]
MGSSSDNSPAMGTNDAGLGLEWSLPGMAVSTGMAMFGTAVPTGTLDDMAPFCDSTFLFNQPPPDPAANTMPSQASHPPHYSAPSSSSSPQPESSPKPDLKRRGSPVDPVTALKRQRNNVAAKKYRQKRIDRITELESELSEVKHERDDLRIRLARQEAEAAALRTMLQMKSGSSAKG